MKSDDKLLPQQHHKRMQDFGVKLVSLRCCFQNDVYISYKVPKSEPSNNNPHKKYSNKIVKKVQS